MYFGQIDKDEVSINCNNIKIGKRIVQYEIFDKRSIVVLLVSNTDNWKCRDEIISIYSGWNDYKVLWSYKRNNTNNCQIHYIHKIWEVLKNGQECIACSFVSTKADTETYVFDIETGEIIESN